jgi:hypothetical protein
MTLTPRPLLTCLTVAAASLALLGCSSMKKQASASFASVTIRGHTEQQIRATTATVFQQDGYTATRMLRGEMVFEKEGSQWDRIAYGSWVSDNSVWIRVRATLVPLGQDEFRLQCQAYQVRDKSDPLVESEVRMRNNKSKPFQALLDKVLGQLARTPAEESTTPSQP